MSDVFFILILLPQLCDDNQKFKFGSCIRNQLAIVKVKKAFVNRFGTLTMSNSLTF